MPVFFAHSAPDTRADGQQGHPLSVHLRDTGNLAKKHLGRVGGCAFGLAAGLLHDLGKYSLEFQQYLAGSGKQVEHSTAGARVAIEKYGPKLGKILAFCIAGHHAGLANGDGVQSAGRTLEQRLDADYRIPAIDDVWTSEITLPEHDEFFGLKISPAKTEKEREEAAFGVSLLIRMLFSALVNADRADARAWHSGEKTTSGIARPPAYPSIADLQEKLDQHLSGLNGKSPINRLRRQVLEDVRVQASRTPGLFSLTVPTGGGKTLSSLAFALEHAKHHGLDRVVYVIPYISIVDQTARAFRKVLGCLGNAVLEHHSNFDESRTGDKEGRDALRLAMETWDRPIVVTTAVQFYESLFSHQPSRCRKLHNLIGSVIVLDEAQTLPFPLLRPCVAVIRELARSWYASVILCTATQPALHALKPALGFSGGLENVRELVPDPKALYTQRSLRRTQIVREPEPIADAELASRLLDTRQVLCIVNTRRHARELYGLIRQADGALHLTTALCAHHRAMKLRHVTRQLQHGAPVRLIATSLVEAGVDIDFPVVWRAEAGLEAIIQAAGRCNREGRRKSGEVHVFQAEARRHEHPGVAQAAGIARGVMRRHADPMSLEAIEDYFCETYWIKGNGLDKKNILEEIRNREGTLNFPFRDIAEKFRMVETAMEPIIIVECPAGAGHRGWNAPGDLFDESSASVLARRAQTYVVQIPAKARAALLQSGAARTVREHEFEQQFVRLGNPDLYDPETGLNWNDPYYRTAESLIQ